MIEPTVVLPAAALPDSPAERDSLLQHYVDERVPHTTRTDNGDWAVRLAVPPTADYYIDPELESGLRWWGSDIAVPEIPFAHTRIRDIGVCLSDAWTLAFWSDYFGRTGGVPPSVTVIHLDDHDDLMTPRLTTTGEGTFRDMVNNEEFSLTDSAGVRSAIATGAIGMGSFLAPLLHTAEHTQVLHLCDTRYADTRQGEFSLVATPEPDTLLHPGAARPGVRFGPPRTGIAGECGSYRVDRDLPALLGHVDDRPVLLHIDLDFFNNRFNGDSDWRSTPARHDPPRHEVLRRVEAVVAQLQPVRSRIVDVTIGVSPGFFPAELWQPVCEKLVNALSEC